MRARIIAAGFGLAFALAANPALAQYGPYPVHAYPPPAYPAAYPAPAPAAFPVDRALAEHCGFRAGSSRRYAWPS